MAEHLVLPASLAGIADRLLACGAITFEEGDRSFAINLRTSDHPTSPGPLSSEVVTRIGWAIARVLDRKQVRFDTIVGIPHAGTPIARAIAAYDPDSLSPVFLRKIERGEGSHHAYRYTFGFDGVQEIYEHPHVVLVDAVLGPTSTREGVELFSRHRIRVRHVVGILDSGDGVCEALRMDGLSVHTLFSLHSLSCHFLATGQITKVQHARVMAYLGFLVS